MCLIYKIIMKIRRREKVKKILYKSTTIKQMTGHKYPSYAVKISREF